MKSIALVRTVSNAMLGAVTLISASASARLGWANQIDIIGPAGSSAFGTTVTVLPNGNIVVSDSGASGSAAHSGAVYLYDPRGNLISTLTGSTVGDAIGRVVRVSGNNFVVFSSLWNNGSATQAGAVTWVNGTLGLSGSVSPGNSLVGTHSNDHVGLGGVDVLSNGNYVVRSPDWSNGTADAVGAATWGRGSTGIVGPVSASNSLVGTTGGDQVGLGRAFALRNGNYIVLSPSWNSGANALAGAVTWGNGLTGIVGPVSAANSLVGTSANDSVGDFGATELSNGNYVVMSPHWNNGPVIQAGAATWASSQAGGAGAISPSNSLVGTTDYDQVGRMVVALTNGNYVVGSPTWNSGAATQAGAVTWANGTTGLTGAVSPSNSLVGSSVNDEIGFKSLGFFGSAGIHALSNGNYVVSSLGWNNGSITQAGAVTWVNGSTGLTGAISAANSLVGMTAFDHVGSGVFLGDIVPLNNGNYVIVSQLWNNGSATSVGAVTWADGTHGLSGAVSPGNSLVGTSANDQVGWGGVAPLASGNYVVDSPLWSNGPSAAVGAVTWVNGSAASVGPVSSNNSLIGMSPNDEVGFGGVTALTDGSYVVASPFWNNGTASRAGAATWGDGAKGATGAVSTNNSWVGTASDDQVARSGVFPLANGHYVVLSGILNAGAITQAGAVTWASGKSPLAGTVSTANSLVGTMPNDSVGYYGVRILDSSRYIILSSAWNNGGASQAGAITLASDSFRVAGTIQGYNSVRANTAGGGSGLVFDYDPTRLQLVVGRPADNVVSLFTMDQIFADGFEQ